MNLKELSVLIPLLTEEENEQIKLLGDDIKYFCLQAWQDKFNLTVRNNLGLSFEINRKWKEDENKS